MAARWARLAAFLAIATAVTLGLQLSLGTPICILADAHHDDALFVERARHLVAGDWLGPYDRMTLAKGPGYPFFLAAGIAAGLPVGFERELFRLAAALLAGAALARLSGSRGVGVAACLVLLLDPLPRAGPLLRLTRDSIYTEQVLVLLAALVFAFRCRRLGSRLAWAIVAGLVLGWAWLTREEGPWLLPGLAASVALLLPRTVREQRWPAASAVLLALSASFAALLGGFAWRNGAEYGYREGVEFSEGNFRAAVAALEAVESAPPIPYVPVTRQARRRLYEVSPSFARLRDSLDPPGGPTWQSGCAIYPWTCGEIAGGWFVWALRGAVERAGEYRSPARAATFYAGLAAEVERACASGALRCRPSWQRAFPRPGPAQRAAWRDRFVQAIRLLALAPPPELDPPPSSGTGPEYQEAMRVVGFPLATPLAGGRPRIEMQGWFYARDESWPVVQWTDRFGRKSPVELERRASPALAARTHDPGATNQRFLAELPRDVKGHVRFRVGRARRDLAIEDLLGRRGEWRLGKGTLRLDSVTDWGDSEIDAARVAASRRVRGVLLRIDRVLAPALLLAGLPAMVIAGRRWRRRREGGELLAAALALWVFVASRLVLLAVVDMTAFPALHYLYAGPAPQLAWLASLASVAAAARPGIPRSS